MFSDVELDLLPSLGQVEREYLGVMGHLFDLEESGLEGFQLGV